MVMSRMSQGLPSRFAPEWPPKSLQPDEGPSVYVRCSNQFKKVTWPPNPEPERDNLEMPMQTVQLKGEIPLNDEAVRPVGTYKAAPTIYAEDPEQLPETWPPPEPINTNERVIHDPSRPKRAIRDYAVYFGKNAAPPVQPSYQVPPGTLHVISQRGVLSYDTPDLGGARMAPSSDV